MTPNVLKMLTTYLNQAIQKNNEAKLKDQFNTIGVGGAQKEEQPLPETEEKGEVEEDVEDQKLAKIEEKGETP
jgi:hypothetical protein